MGTNYTNLWYKHASIRYKDRILLNKKSSQPFFPEDLQPLCSHHLVLELAPTAKDQVLIQSCYKYLQEVCITETDVVTPTCLNIAYGMPTVEFIESIKADAFSIVADEAFHSYVARDFMMQLQEFTGIKPIIIPRENEATKAMKTIIKNTPSEYHLDFALAATCISENIFTDEIIAVSRFSEVNESFHQVMLDHAKDEGRHAGYFIKVMSTYWAQINETKKLFFVKAIPEFIKYCLDGDNDRDFTTKLLKTLGMNDKNIEICFNDSVNKTLKDNKTVRGKNITKFLNKSGMLSFEPLTNALNMEIALG